MLEAIKWMRDDMKFPRDDMEMRRERSEMMRGEAEILEIRRDALELVKLMRRGFLTARLTNFWQQVAAIPRASNG